MTKTPSIHDLVKAAIEDPERPNIPPRYDAEGVEYVNARTKVPLWCSEHGTFWLLPRDIERRSYLCAQCRDELKNNDRHIKELELTDKIRKKFGKDAFDTSQIRYLNTQTPVTVICKKHKTRHYLIPYDLEKTTYLCTDCRDEGMRSRLQATPESFIEKAKTKHGDRYSYDEVDYQGSHKKVLIRCREHGVFEQTPASHLNGRGCPACGKAQVIAKKKARKNQLEKQSVARINESM